jgi:uncharacterized coiled-coil protein SlyX
MSRTKNKARKKSSQPPVLNQEPIPTKPYKVKKPKHKKTNRTTGNQDSTTTNNNRDDDKDKASIIKAKDHDEDDEKSSESIGIKVLQARIRDLEAKGKADETAIAELKEQKEDLSKQLEKAQRKLKTIIYLRVRAKTVHDGWHTRKHRNG